MRPDAVNSPLKIPVSKRSVMDPSRAKAARKAPSTLVLWFSSRGSTGSSRGGGGSPQGRRTTVSTVCTPFASNFLTNSWFQSPMIEPAGVPAVPPTGSKTSTRDPPW
jgi:hypothetical protein